MTRPTKNPSRITKAEMRRARERARKDEHERLLAQLRRQVSFSAPEDEIRAEAHDIVYGKRSHEALLKVVHRLPTDYEPFGQVTDEEREQSGKPYADCSCGCRYFIPLEHHGLDWGACVNPKSPRAGMLTFEHQGCLEFALLPVPRKRS